MTIWVPSIARDETGRPLYVVIAQAIEADILSGRLKPGDQLPTHRDLADRLKVTVGTVSRGYNEARKAGWISGEIGRGTYVLDRNAGRFPSTRDDRDNVIDLSLNVPVESSAPDLAAALRGLSAMEDTQSLLQYAPTDSHSSRLAGQMILERHGLMIDADKVVLCAGTQHGLGVALDAVARSGDCILAEELTYPAFKPLADARGLRTYPVALDEHGIVPSALHAACRKVRPKALYIVPTLHNPTTGTLSASRRREVVDIARRHNLIIIEDDLYRLLAVEAPPPIARVAPERTIYVTSLSKTFAPGLRVGYLVGPPSQYNNLVRAVQQSIWMLSPITTTLAARWILQGEFDSIVAGKRKEAAARQSLAAKILPRHRVRSAKTSYHLWLSTEGNADAFALAARERGVLITPASAFYLGSARPPEAVRVSLSAARDRAVLVTALERLGELMEEPDASMSARL
jgi:DNA-binding transcriptional MocR family regulator